MWPFKNKTKYLKPGEIGICIDDRDWNVEPQSINLQYKKLYKIISVIKCPNCGSISYDIGCKLEDNKKHTWCKKVHNLPGQGIHYAGSFRFAKVDRESMSEEELESVLETYVKEEHYEMAADIRDLIEK